jgi:hypothetical protein
MTTHDHGPTAGPHHHHDRLLISAHAAGDLAGRELATADALLAACEDCRALHADLLTIASSTHELPAPLRPPVRDFRISPERAATLARGGFWRRVLRPFARPGGASRPLALAFTTLGMAGLLLATLPSMPLNGGDDLTMVQAPAGSDGRNAAQPTEMPEVAASPDIDTSGGEYQPDGVDTGAGASPGPGKGAGAGQGSGARPTAEPTGGKVVPEVAVIDDTTSGPSPLVLLSVAFLAAGLGLVLLRLTARRLG